MSWGGLNPALTAWRNAYNARLPGRGTASDGGYADAAHGSTSQHQQDADGTVDANDMDVNVLGSGTPTGTKEELRIVEAMKLDFERDPHKRGHLWIHDREIAQHDNSWAEVHYGGDSPHTEHVHWESRQDHETNGAAWPMPETDRVLQEMGLMAFNAEQVEQITDAAYEALNRKLPGTAGISTFTGVDRVHKATTGGTGDALALWARLDALEAALARIEAALPPAAG